MHYIYMNYPISTYRIQLNSSFTFKELASIIDYLETLGITTVYASPITSAVKDSSHGYDVTDSGILNPQIGTYEELEQLAETLKKKNMNWIQDIVPNHMAFSTDNSKLMDVLERGMISPYYTYFDINWNHSQAPGKILVPILGDDLNTCIKNQQVKLSFTDHGFKVFLYGEQQYPLSVTAFAAIMPLMHQQSLSGNLINKIEALIESSNGKGLSEWISEKNTFSEELSIEDRKALEKFADAINRDSQLVADILERQPYQFVSYKTADSIMNYRRFFTINNLICLRVEDEFVFNDYHQLLLSLYKKNLVHGFRLDHIDGLYDPLQYIQRLRKETGEECYIIVEKILDGNEELPENWCIEGTTGYEFLAFTNRILTDKEGSDKLITFYKDFTGLHETYETIVYDKKHTFLYRYMLGELDNLMTLLDKLFLIDEGIDHALLKDALGVFMAAFPVYRIYPDQFPLPDVEMKILQLAFDRASQKAPDLEKEFVFIKSLFEETDTQIAARKLSFIKRLMQFTGPLSAKGVEDTTFYIYNPLISHNEVGDAPSPLAFTIDQFHKKMYTRQKQSRFSLNTTSTHDTKRGENARARINALSHLHKKWMSLVPKWHDENKIYVQQVKGRSAPSLNDEYFIYQSLLGSYPEMLIADEVFIERSKQFLRKALREAKTETNYDTPDTEYEEACLQFVESIIKTDSTFLTTFIPLLEKVIDCAAIIAIAQIVLKTTAPGIPDFYQGCELSDLSYVDPDNRRYIDYDCRKRLLNKIIEKEKEPESLFEYLKTYRDEGTEQLYVTRKMLLLRKKYADVFLNGNYIPLEVNTNVLAYMRQLGNNSILILIPLCIDEEYGIDKDLQSIEIKLPEASTFIWKNVFTNEIMTIQQGIVLSAFTKFPIAVFENIK